MSEFFAMNGYGFYVWSAYGVTALALASSSSRCGRAAGRRSQEARLARPDAPAVHGSGRMKPRHRRFLWIGAGVLLLAAAVGPRAERVPVESRLLLLADRRRRASRSARPRVPHRRAGRGEEPDAAAPTASPCASRSPTPAQTIPVVYTGILPDLFKEGKGVVAQGKIGPDGVFHATEVLAKHDENYMPPEAAAARRPGAISRAAMDKAAKTLKP